MRSLLAGGAVALLASCAVAPPYVKPKLDLPAEWKVEAPFRAGTPSDAAPRGAWWERFGDERLNQLVQKALTGNPTLAIAGARLAQARASLAGARSQSFPQVGLGARENRFRITENRPLTNYNARNFSTEQNDFVVNLTASYELDVQGRVAAAIEGAGASAEQAEADLQNVRLLMLADLATAYFNLRQVDVELEVLERSIGLQRRTLGLARTRHELGAASGLDVAQQQSLIDTTLTQLDLLRRQRAQFEHAVATLTGTPAPAFTLAADRREILPPPVPLGVPSDVLERRPDVAAAERAMAAANAQVGVANAAFYPSFTIGAAAGFQSRMIDTLFDVPSRIWAFGASLLLPIFDGGRLDANLSFAKAGYDATVANYRRVVLTALQEAEDGILGLAALERASQQSRASVASARRVAELVDARYEGGVANPLEVIVAQQNLLASERLAAQLVGQRLLTTVFLFKALGGDWPGPEKLSAGEAPPR